MRLSSSIISMSAFNTQASPASKPHKALSSVQFGKKQELEADKSDGRAFGVATLIAVASHFLLKLFL